MKTRGKVRQKRKDGLLRQAQIMDLSMKIFAEKGYHATSIEDIVGAAGIAKGTFYLHFESKYDLLNQIIETNLKMLHETLNILDISMSRPVEEIREPYCRVARSLTADPKLKLFIKLLLSEVMGMDRNFISRINPFFIEMSQLSTLSIKKAQQDGRILKTLDPLIASYCIVGSIKEILFHWAVFDEKFDMESAINTLIDIYFKGMIVER